MSEESQELALQSLVEEIRIKFQVLISEDEASSIFRASLMQGNEFFNLGNKILSQLHLSGVVKFPSLDQKFLSESNATTRIKSQMIEFSNGLIIYDPKMLRVLENFINDYPALSNYFVNLESNSSDFAHDLSEDGSINLKEIIEFADENASFSAQELRNDLAAPWVNF